MTTRERREARAARLREWADKREAKAQAGFQAVHDLADSIPMGQPILVGHHSEAHARRDQDRIHSGMRRAVDNQDTAKEMRQKAANIESAVDRAIYSDDPDAREQLERKIADLEAQRAAITAYNLDCRKAAKTGGHGDLSLLEWDTPSGSAQIAPDGQRLRDRRTTPTGVGAARLRCLKPVRGTSPELRKRMDAL